MSRCLVKKKYIPPYVREEVWRLYGSSVCWCCQQESISSKNKHFGHIQAESEGGQPTVDNLRPICQNCNLRMGTQNMYDFMMEQGYPVRDIAIIQRALRKKPIIQDRLKGKCLYFVPNQRGKGGYSCTIGIRRLYQQYPFLRHVSLTKLFTVSEVNNVTFYFISQYRYCRWFRHMMEQTEMYGIFHELQSR